MRPLEALEAEEAVVGALMRDASLCETIGAYLDQRHFADQDVGALYKMALMARSMKQEPDAITLSEISPVLPSGTPTMKRAGLIQMGVVSTANVNHFAKIVIERSKARQMAEVGKQITMLANSTGNIADQVAQAQALVMDLAAGDDSPDVVSMREALGPVIDEMDDRFNGVKHTGLDFGHPDLDALVSHLRPGNLVIIAGRPGTGKTVLGANLADKIAIRDGGASLFFSLEMPKEELAKRSLSAESMVPQKAIETGSALSSEEFIGSIQAAVGRLAAADIRIADKSVTFARLCAIARFQHRARKLSAIFVDYLQLIQSDPASKHQNRNQELGAVSRGLKALAKELGIPVVALAQLNRGIESRGNAKPRMSDLRDSGEIEQDADVIIMAHRDDDANGENGITHIGVVKVRHGKTGECVLQLRGDIAKFVSIADPNRYMNAEEPERKSARDFISKGKGKGDGR